MINSIFITSLTKEDKEFFKFDSLYENIENQLSINSLGNFNIKSSSEFISTLTEIETYSIKGDLILQINMHGDPFSIGFIDNSILKWDEFHNYLRKLNNKVQGNLYLVMAVCYGMYFKKVINYPVDIKEKQNSPFRGIIASKSKVFVYEANEMFIFYKTLSETVNITIGFNSFVEKVPRTNLEYQDLYNIGLNFLLQRLNNIFKDSRDSIAKNQLFKNLKEKLDAFFIVKEI